MNKDCKIEYVYSHSPDAEQRLFRVLSMLISEDDLYEKKLTKNN